jgi:hypothetical protein
MIHLPRIGLYIMTIFFLLLVVAFRMVMDVERLNLIARILLTSFIGSFALASHAMTRGLAKQKNWGWWGATTLYGVLTLFFLYFQVFAIVNTPSHPFRQGVVAGGLGGGLLFFFTYLYLFLALASVSMVVILLRSRERLTTRSFVSEGR